MDLKLAGRSVLITGGSKGIGFGVARWFAQEGCNLRLAARSQEGLDRAKAKLLQIAKVEVRTYAMDLSKAESRERLVAACSDADIIINNAGGIPGGTIEDVDDAKWRAAWDLKVFGYINMSRAFFTLMKARKSGVIINIIGAGGERLDAGYIAGATGNAALMAFTRTLGGDSLDYGVRVIGVNPGQIETDRLRVRLEIKAEEAFGAKARWKELLKNPLGQPQEIADLVAYLASPRASFISGTIVTADAGRAARHVD